MRVEGFIAILHQAQIECDEGCESKSKQARKQEGKLSCAGAATGVLEGEAAYHQGAAWPRAALRVCVRRRRAAALHRGH